MKKIIPYLALVLMLIAIAKVSAQSTALDTIAINALVENSKSPQVTLISQSPDPAVAGDNARLTFMVENMGGEKLDGLSLQFIPLYPFYALPGEDYVKQIPALEPHQMDSSSVVVKFTVGVDRAAAEGTGQVKIREVTPATSMDQLFNVDITGQKFAQIIYIDTSKMQPGNETNIKFTVTNTGSSPLQNLVFSWNEATGAILPVYSDNTKYVKYLDVNQSVDLPYTVVANVNANPGLYQLNLDLKFQSENGTTGVISTKAGISIGGETDFDVAFSQSSQGQTSLSIANIGNTPAYSVTVSIPQQPGFRVSGSESSIIGNLDKGDYTLVSFQLSSAITQNSTAAQGEASAQNGQFRRQFNQTAGAAGGAQQRPATAFGGNLLDVRIDYTDTTGSRHIVHKSVPIQFRDISSASSTDTALSAQSRARQQSLLSSPAVIAGIVIAVIIAGAVIVRRRNRANAALLAKRKRE